MSEQTARDGWFKSTRSANNAACVEVRFGDGTVQVRDSKNVAGPALTFDVVAWADFVDGIKAAAS